MAASGKTFLQLINAVLPRLREATVSAWNETTYSTFIGGLINAVKTEIEAAYYWQALRTIISVTTSSSDTAGQNYTLTGSGSESAIVDAWNTTVNQRLARATNLQYNEWLYGNSTAQTGQAALFLPGGLDSGSSYDRQVNIIPAPAAAETLKFEVYIPQADLSADATVPLVPQSLLIEEVVARALVERGDETAPKPQPGETFILKDLLAAAVSRESARDEEEMDWDAD